MLCPRRMHGEKRPGNLSGSNGPATAPALLSFATQSVSPTQATSELLLKLPLKAKSVRFAVIGDSGTGRSPQFEVAREMEAYRRIVDFSFVIMLGDNIYGGHSPRDFVKKFEEPYKPLLDAGVKFYASIGNHDSSASVSTTFSIWGVNVITVSKRMM